MALGDGEAYRNTIFKNILKGKVRCSNCKCHAIWAGLRTELPMVTANVVQVLNDDFSAVQPTAVVEEPMVISFEFKICKTYHPRYTNLYLYLHCHACSHDGKLMFQLHEDELESYGFGALTK